ncbi:hypothetical protein [Pseudogracilibacillus sp. SO30301A]|uniref:hypothetical protein n=1 Tax=Pseudogracilibacillus sp. SO30301A TaxID=3098291 RepID=UPI00300E1845
MTQLTEQEFLDVKDEIKDGRLSPGSIRVFLGAFMFFSLIMIGVSYIAANASNTVIGWENLSTFWQTVFWSQVVLFGFQLILIFFVKGKINFTQIILIISYVIYTYKMVLDPFVLMSMFAMDRGVYETFAPIFIIIIIVGFLLHLYLIQRSFKDLKKEKSNKRKKEKNGKISYAFIPILFLLVSITGYIIKNELLGENEILFGTGIFTFLYIAVMIGAVEFVMGAYCVIRFPSFRVNPPSNKKKNA